MFDSNLYMQDFSLEKYVIISILTVKISNNQSFYNTLNLDQYKSYIIIVLLLIVLLLKVPYS